MAILPLFTLALTLLATPQQGAQMARSGAPVAEMAQDESESATATEDSAKASGDDPIVDPFGLGFGLFDGLLDRSTERQLAEHVPACEQGDAEACGQAGENYNFWMAKTHDPAKAREYFSRSCAMKPSKWCNEAGKLAGQGKGGPTDQQYALTAFQLACLSGDKRGCSNVALMKYHGLAVPQDLKAARREWTAICENDRIQAACHNLARMWMEGEGGEPMPEAATAMYEKLCQEKYNASCKMLETDTSQ